MVSTDPPLEWHEMAIVRVDKNNAGDLEFEFACSTCDFRETFSFFEILAGADLRISHAESPDGGAALQITLRRREGDLPQCFKDFLDSMGADF